MNRSDAFKMALILRQEQPLTYRPLRKVVPRYVDEDGLHWTIVGWHCTSGTTRYLIEYSRPGACDRVSHAIHDQKWVPDELLEGFHHSESLQLGRDSFDTAHIRLHNIIQVLDIAWCSDLMLEAYTPTGRTKFDDFFVHLMWKDEDGNSNNTWEAAEVLMQMMDQNHCSSLLALWVHQAEHRHDQLVTNCPAIDIQDVLAAPGWQYC